MTRDDALTKQIVKANAFKVLIDIFLRNIEKYNLLYSTVLAIFEVIKRENIRLLIGYVAECLRDNLQPAMHLESVRTVLDAWERMPDTYKQTVLESLPPDLRASGPSPPQAGDPEPQANTEAASDSEVVTAADGIDREAAGSPVTPVSLVAYGEEDDAETRANKRRKVAADDQMQAEAAT